MGQVGLSGDPGQLMFWRQEASCLAMLPGKTSGNPQFLQLER